MSLSHLMGLHILLDEKKTAPHALAISCLPSMDWIDYEKPLYCSVLHALDLGLGLVSCACTD